MFNTAHFREMQIKTGMRCLPYTGQTCHHQKVYKINAGECVDKREVSYIVGGNVNQYSHLKEQYRGSLKN